MLNIYTKTISARLKYICDTIFNNVLMVDYRFVLQISSEITININYSDTTVENAIQILPHKLLFESDVDTEILSKINCEQWDDLPFFFRTSTNVEIPFDIFAASFFLVSRYEEYLSFESDFHGRFQSSKSIASKFNFLDKPLVNQWWIKLMKNLKYRFPDLDINTPKYRYLPTIDIDSFYAFRCKGLIHNLACAIRDLFKRDFRAIKYRFKVLAKKRKDPFDNYDYMFELFAKYKLSPIFFILTANSSAYDKAKYPFCRHLKELLKNIAYRYKIGIHPGYKSNFKNKLVAKEILRLKKVVKRPITRSRQHYLMLKFPQTYQNLISCGIKEDYSLGYADTPGFRASTCTPFFFYDLANEIVTELKMYPFQIMDVSLKHYKKLGTIEALDVIEKIIKNTKDAGGMFVSLWHNESLGKNNQWRGWLHVYEEMTKLAAN